MSITMETNLPYLSCDPDRHGNERIYVRRNGKRIRIREPEGTPAFARAYTEAVDKLGATIKRATIIGPAHPTGSLGWLGANLAYALLYRGHVGEANARVTEYWEVARGVATQTWSMAAVESGVGIELGDLDRAARALDHAESAGDLGERIGLVLRNHRAAVCRASGEWARAEALERSILGRSVAGGRNGDMVACAARGLAESLAGQGRHEDALEPARLAARTGRGEDRAEWAAGLRVLGGSLTALGRRAEATRAFQEALSLHDRAEFELERRRLDADLSRLGFGDLARVTLDSASQMAGGRADRLRSEELSLRSGRIAGERAALERALTESGGNVSRAARSLGLSRQAFYKAMRRTGLSADARA